MTARDTADAEAPVSLAKAGDGDAPPAGTDDTADARETAAAGASADASADSDHGDDPGDDDGDRPRGRRRREGRRRHRDDDDGRAGAARRPRRRLLVVALVVAALFAGGSATAYYVAEPDPVAGLTSSQQAAVSAAGQAAINLQTFRRASFDADFANAQASLTQAYGQEFASRKQALKQQLDKAGRDATATVKSTGLVSSSGDQAVVLVVTNAVQTADNGQTTPFVFSRLQLTLQRVDGRWLVSDLTNVGLS